MNHPKQIFKVTIDILMILLLIMEMNTRVINPKIHMLLGILLFILFITHNIVNIKWYKRAFKEPMTLLRTITIIINLALLLNMFTVIISAAFLPDFMNKCVPYSTIYTARDIHTMAAYWLFVITSIHLGIHPATADHKKSSSGKHQKNIAKYILLVLVCAYGIKAFISRNVIIKLAGFASVNQLQKDSSIIYPFIDYLSIMIMLSYVSYLVLHFIKEKSN